MTAELIPPDDTDGIVEIAVSRTDSEFTIPDAPGDVDRLLYDKLAYAADGAEWTDAYKNGHWDGYTRLYDRATHSAPIGLLDRARDALEQDGYTVNVTATGSPTTEPISTAWEFPHDLREYQEHAVSDVLSDRGGLVSLPTGAGKTVVGLRLIHTIGQRAIILVHTKELLDQWAVRVRDTLDVDPGRIGDDEWSEGPVTVAVMQTLVSRGTDQLGTYPVAVFDECHRTTAADTMHDVGMAIHPAWRIGLSATPWRNVDGEELKIEGAVGGVTAEVSAETLIEAGHLARPEFRVIDPAEYGRQATANGSEGYQSAYERCIVQDSTRNRAVATTAADAARDGRSVFVSVRRINHGETLAEWMSQLDAGVRAAFLCGEDSSETRGATIAAFDNGEIDVLVSTLLKEGVDVPSINAIVLSGGGKSDTEKVQTVGRALRPHNGETALIADVRDRGPYFGEHYHARREAFSDYYGRFGPNSENGDVVKVRRWLAGQGLPVGALRVYESEHGGVLVEPAEYLGDDEYGKFVDVMQRTDAIEYDGNRNVIRDTNRLSEVS